MENILLIGKNGQLGWELTRVLQPLGNIIPVDFPEIDLASENSIMEWVDRTSPGIILNAAAYTAVDKAEADEATAMAVNGQAPGLLAELAEKKGSALIHFSTDYVFDGKKNELYVEDDEPNPLNVYGWSKLAGENSIIQVDGSYLVLRTSWVYSLRVGGFVNKVIQWSRENPELRIVSDQVGSPTWARMLAEITGQVIAKGSEDIYPWIKEKRGVYHLGGAGQASRLEWAERILAYDMDPDKQKTKRILPAKTNDFPTPAQRPLFTPLNCDLFMDTFNFALPAWDIALKLAMSGN